MLIINYDGSRGLGVADNRTQEYVRSAFSKSVIKRLKHKNFSINVGSKAVIFFALDRVAQKEIPHKQVQFRYCGTKLTLHPNGELLDAPPELRKPDQIKRIRGIKASVY
jgi:hypothetical protein